MLGASGYAGGELVRLLVEHPSAELAYLGAGGSAGRLVRDVHPHLASTPAGDRRLEPIELAALLGALPDVADVVFSALPHGRCAQIAPGLLEAGLRVVDLSGDFRLPAGAYPDWYGFDHPAPAWLGKAVYGLPELAADRLPGAQLIANPGCFPTPVILGLAPLLAAGLLEAGPVHVDGKTGLSGAGRAASETTTYAAAEESIRPYRVPGHQHTPEMENGIEAATGISLRLVFAPHLVPAVRGVVTTSFAPLAAGATTESLTEALAEAYRGRRFVRVLPPGDLVDSKRVRGTNVLELAAIADPRSGTAIVIGALDNLIKGAAGQAIQNMNLAIGLPEEAALPVAGAYP